jgi:cephalosporin hydroxylase
MRLFSSNTKLNFTKQVQCSIKTIAKGHHNVTYRGVPCIKSPFDYLLYQMIINQTQPDLIIEIGTNEGGSALYMADLLKINDKGIIHTIDIVDKCNSFIKDNPRIHRFLGGWAEYNLNLTKDYEKVLIIDDGSHTYQDVLGVLNKFTPILKQNDYIIIEDGIVDKLNIARDYNGGPQKAIKEFLQKNNSLQIDRFWCDFFGTNTTFNPNGFLIKK